MFKKSLLALAFAGASISANAATVATQTTLVSFEGNVQLGASTVTAADLTNDNVTITAGSAYIANDVFVVTVAGATFDITKTITAESKTSAGAASGATLDFVDYQDANTARFRVSGGDHPNAGTVTVTGFELKTTGATAATKIQFSSKAVSINPSIGDYDKAAAATVAEFKSELKLEATTKLDGVISTAKGRQQFTTGLADSLVLAVTDTAGLTVDNLTFTKYVHTLKGTDFSFAMDYDLKANGGNADGKLSSAELAKAFVITGGTNVLALNDAKDTLTITDSAAAAAMTINLTTVGQAKSGTVLSAQAFTVSTVATQTNASVSNAAISAGSFTLDGKTENISFLPFDEQYARSVTVTNTGTVAGEVTANITADGKTYTKVLTASAAAKSVTDISAEVAALASDSGVTGNAAVEIVVNAPAAFITVDAIYYSKADQDRVKVK